MIHINPRRMQTFGRSTLAAGLGLLLLGCFANTEHQINYGLNHYEMGLYGQAIPALVAAENSLAKTSPPDPRLPRIQIALGDMASAEDRSDLAEGFYKKAMVSAEHLATPNKILVRNSWVHAGNFYLRVNRPAEALPLLLRASEMTGSSPDFSRTLYAIDLDNLAQAYSGLGREKEGQAASMKALGVLDGAQADPETEKTRGIIYFNLAVSHQQQHQNAEAEAFFKKSLEVLSPLKGPKAGSPSEIRTLIKAYSGFLRGLGRLEEAALVESRMPKPILQ